MHEKRIPPSNKMKKIEFPDEELYVIVNEFEKDTLKWQLLMLKNSSD